MVTNIYINKIGLVPGSFIYNRIQTVDCGDQERTVRFEERKQGYPNKHNLTRTEQRKVL